jgi:hypothetical protein
MYMVKKFKQYKKVYSAKCHSHGNNVKFPNFITAKTVMKILKKRTTCPRRLKCIIKESQLKSGSGVGIDIMVMVNSV